MSKLKLLVMATMMAALLSGNVQAGLFDPPIDNPSCESVDNGGTPGNWGYIIDDWYENEQRADGTARTDACYYEKASGIGIVGDGDLWFGAEGDQGEFYQVIGTWDAGQTYEITLLIGARSGNFGTGAMRLYAGGVEAGAADGTDLSDISGVTLLDEVEYGTADGTLVSTDVYEVTLELSTGDGQTPGSTLWLEFGSVSGKDYFDNIQITLIGGGGFPAWEPDPPDDPDLTGAEIPTNKTMSWKTGEDPNDGFYGAGPHPSIKGHYVYLTTDKAALEALPAGDETTFPDLNRGYQLVGSETYTPGVYNEVTNPNGLDTDEVYYWRIDERSEYGGGQDPNIWIGPIWTFQTTKLLPVIDEQPQDTAVFPGDPAELSISVTSATQETYAWKKVNPAGEDPNVGTDSDTLSFASAQVDPDEGQYYCVVTNDAGPETSNTAWLEIKRLVGHWPFEENLDDIASGNHGVKNDGDPNFVPGIVGSFAIEMDGIGEYIDVPIAALDRVNTQVSVSLWINNGPIKSMTTFGAYDATGNRMISAHVPWVNDTVYFDAGNPTGYDRINRGITYSELSGNWNHFVFTKNSDTGDMKIYYNGRLWHSGVGMTRTLYGAISFMIGRGFAAGENHRGLIDDFRLYNFELNPFEVALLYTRVRQDEVICAVSPAIDYNNDCVQDILDLEIFLRTWLECKNVRGCWSPDHPLD